MNLKGIILVIFVLFQMINLFSQRVEFSYDESGNRTGRTIIVELLRPNSVIFPVLNPKTLNSTENAVAKGLEIGTTSQNADRKALDDSARERIKQEDGEIVTLVYPNPNKGLVKIEISNMPLNSKNEMRLYNLSGTELIVKRNFESYSEIDISRFKDGIYILRIKVNESVFDWKVIKNHE